MEDRRRNNLWITDAPKENQQFNQIKKYKKTFQFWKKYPDTGDWEGSTEIINTKTCPGKCF